MANDMRVIVVQRNVNVIFDLVFGKEEYVKENNARPSRDWK